MHVLGISCGTPNGNSEILLKIALKEITTQVPGTTIAILRISSVAIPTVEVTGPWDEVDPDTPRHVERDDRPAAMEAILKADALIVASPIYSREPAGYLKYFCDRTLGPRQDAAFAKAFAEGKQAPNALLATMRPDLRVLKPRVAASIAVGGAASDEWGSLALPGLHGSHFFSLHAKVVDQMVVYGCSAPGMILLNEKKEFREAIEKAKRLGRNVASQMGKTFDEAQYLGDINGACPHCHLSVIVMNEPDGRVTCASCGAKGKLVMKDGVAVLDVSNQPETSVITMEGKVRHMNELMDIAKEMEPKAAVWEQERQKWKSFDKHVLKL